MDSDNKSESGCRMKDINNLGYRSFKINWMLTILILLLVSTSVSAVIIGGRDGGYFEGTIDALRIYNRSVSAKEAQQHYYSNLVKYDIDKWYFYSNQSDLTIWNYTYRSYMENTDGIKSETEERQINIVNGTAPSIKYTLSTKPDDDVVEQDYIFVEVEIIENNLVDTTFELFDSNDVLINSVVKEERFGYELKGYTQLVDEAGLGIPAEAIDISSVTYNPATDTLFVVDNRNEFIYEVDKTDYGLINSIELMGGFEDIEGISYISTADDGDHWFAIVEEQKGDLSLLKIDPTADSITYGDANHIPYDLGLVGLGNDGLEGVAYDNKRDVYYVVVERNNKEVYQIDLSADPKFTPLFDAESVFAGILDLSDIYYDNNTDTLFILSDMSDILINVDLEGNIISSLNVGDMFKPEGITFDTSREYLYVTSEPKSISVWKTSTFIVKHNFTGQDPGTYRYNVTARNTLDNKNSTETREITLKAVRGWSNIDYPSGVYELTDVFDGQYTSDTFTINFEGVTADIGDELACDVIDSEGTIHPMVSDVFTENVINVPVELSHTLEGTPYQPGTAKPDGTDPSGHVDKSWYVDNCVLNDSLGNTLKRENEPYPVYVKTTYWWFDNPATGFEDAFDTANAHLARVSGERVYFGHNDATALDFGFAFHKRAIMPFEGVCDDEADNDGDGDIDCDDEDCQTVFYSNCEHVIEREYDGDEITGFVTAITGMATLPGAECKWEIGNICYVNDIGLGTELYYTTSVSQDGYVKARFVKDGVQAITYLILKDTGDFGISDLTTSAYDDPLNPGVLEHKSTDTNLFKMSSRPDAESTTIFDGNLDMVMNISLSSVSVGLYSLTFDGYIGNAMETSTLNVDVGADKPTNNNESDSNLNRDLTPIGGTDTNANSCNDGVDNDLNYKMDCNDSNCDGVQIGITLQGSKPISCELDTETTCWDGFDNDGDGLIDCEDDECDGQIGAYIGFDGVPQKYWMMAADVARCEYGSDSEGTIYYPPPALPPNTVNSCDDKFENDADSGNQYDDYSCIGGGCSGRTIDCYDAYSCWGRSGTGVGVCPLFEDNCIDGMDNDYDAYLQGGDDNWQNIEIFDPNPIDDSTGADCDDYDCSGSGNCPASENVGDGSTCFDDIDNDLDKYVWGGSNYVINPDPSGIDCSDPDCQSIANPDNEDEVCFPYEFEVFSWNRCSDEFDNDGDGKTDCADDLGEPNDCWHTFGDCGPCPAVEDYLYDSCADGLDNDFDKGNGVWDNDNDIGKDCSDTDCNGEIGDYNGNKCELNTETNCSDGFDNDGNGDTDCKDLNCGGIANCEYLTETLCDDNIDNDADGLFDCADEDCYDDVGCADSWETAVCNPTPHSTSVSGAGIDVNYHSAIRKGIDEWRIEFTDIDSAILGDKIEIIIGEGGENTEKAIPFENGDLDITISGSSEGDFVLKKDIYGDEYVLSLESGGAIADLDLIVDIKTTNAALSLDEHDIVINLAAYALGQSSSPEININVLESDMPSVNDIEIEPIIENTIKLEYGSSLSFRGIVVDDSPICECHATITAGITPVYAGDAGDGKCTVTTTFTKNGSYNIEMNATDEQGNEGGAYPESFIVDIIPKDITENYRLDRVFHNNLDVGDYYSNPEFDDLDMGEFKFITGEGDNFIGADCNVIIENVSRVGVHSELISATDTISNKATCSGIIALPVDVADTDGMYFVKVQITDSDGDMVESSSKVFYVCNDLESNGIGWTCAKADFDRDNATEGLFTTLYGDSLACDNCIGIFNPLQTDEDADGIADDCGNRPPSVPVLVTPVNGEDALFDRKVAFDWYDSIDPDEDEITYDINITTKGEADRFYIVGATSGYTMLEDLSVDTEYNWTVRACDDEPLCSVRSGEWNFTIPSTVIINLVVAETNFGTVTHNEIRDTSEGDAAPFVVQNEGNVLTDISVKADESLWTQAGAGLGTDYFRFMAESPEPQDPASFDWGTSQTTWYNVDDEYPIAPTINNLKYENANDLAEIEFRIQVPPSESTDAKSTTLTVRGVIS